jgi:hypothetical protein
MNTNKNHSKVLISNHADENMWITEGKKKSINRESYV